MHIYHICLILSLIAKSLHASAIQKFWFGFVHGFNYNALCVPRLAWFVSNHLKEWCRKSAEYFLPVKSRRNAQQIAGHVLSHAGGWAVSLLQCVLVLHCLIGEIEYKLCDRPRTKVMVTLQDANWRWTCLLIRCPLGSDHEGHFLEEGNKHYKMNNILIPFLGSMVFLQAMLQFNTRICGSKCCNLCMSRWDDFGPWSPFRVNHEAQLAEWSFCHGLIRGNSPGSWFGELQGKPEAPWVWGFEGSEFNTSFVHKWPWVEKKSYSGTIVFWMCFSLPTGS